MSERGTIAAGTAGGPRGIRTVVGERVPWALVVWCAVLGVALPAVALVGAVPQVDAASVMQAVVLAHTAVGLARVLADDRMRVMALGFWLFSYVWLGLAPFAMLVSGRFPLLDVPTRGVCFLACLVVEVGLLAYSVAGFLALRRGATPGGALDRVMGREIRPARATVLGVVALVFTAFMVLRSGGLGAFFVSREERTAQRVARQEGLSATDGSQDTLMSWLLSAAVFWALVAVLFVVASRLSRRTGAVTRGAWRLRWWHLALLAALVVANVVVNNPMRQPRFWFGTVVLGIAFALPWLRRVAVFRGLALVVVGVVIAVFPYADYFRTTVRETMSLEPLGEQLTGNGDYDAFQQIAIGLDFLHRDGLRPEGALGTLLFFVPRSVWPDKPVTTGAAIADYSGYSFQNLSAPLWIEAMLVGGVLAVIAVFAVLGGVSALLDARRPAAAPLSLYWTLVPVLGVYQLILLRGGLGAVIGQIVLVAAIAFLSTGPVRVRAPAAGRPAVEADPAPARAPAAVG